MATVDLPIQDDICLGLLIFVICLSLPLLITIVIGNLVVILSIYRNQELANTSSYIFISSLALFDFLTGLIGLPFAIVGFLLRRQFLYSVNCAIWYFAPCMIFVQVSVLNMVLITFDRFIAIKYPFRYHKWMSPGRAIRISIFADLFGILFGSMSFIVTAVAAIFVPLPNVTYEYDCEQFPLYEYYGAPAYNYLANPLGGLTIPTMFILYAYIFTIASKKAKETATRHGKRVATREMKVTKTTAIVLLVYTLCIAPSVIKGIFQEYIENGSNWLVWYPWFADYLATSNSMVNPFIYAGRSKVMRHEFKETINIFVNKICKRSTRKIAPKEKSKIKSMTI
ncbi:adenosine receptor A2a-like [Anneissia japonica]|uniref:adenosine receptor A2a-like n=1 Tax=Anneissia japonica TaxID=1529436 RepID=UPI0014256510|nr:adenosine receptor A2a-like [Anneissia japonica]